MENVTSFIQTCLPQLSEETLQKTTEILIGIGVDDLEDLMLIQETDLVSVLKPIQIRKLQRRLKGKTKDVQTHKSPHFPIDNSSEMSDTGSDSLFDSPTGSRCSTPSVSSDLDTPSPSQGVTKTSDYQHGSCNWIQGFTIPWAKMPKAILDACDQKTRPKPSERRDMVRIICNQIRQHSTLPGRKNLSKIANMVVTKYRESFCDTVGDTIVGTGYESLRRQLEERLSNSNRKDNKSGSQLVKLNVDDDNTEPPAKKIKKPVRDSYGCLNWLPDSLPDNENEESQKEKQLWLVKEFPKDVIDKAKVSLFMKQTYVSQRLLINRVKPTPASVKEIKEIWPFLFERNNLLQHFELLMGFKLQTVLKQSLEEKSKVIYDYMKQHMQNKKVKKSVSLIEATMTESNSKVAMMSGVYWLLLAYFEEEEDKMIICLPDTATVDDCLVGCPTSPFIAVFGENLLTDRCALVIDGLLVTKGLDGMQDGVMLLFAAYYCFNIHYPQCLAATLEFIQRCFVKLNPEKGTKVTKAKGKNYKVHPKVLSLANSLKDYQSEWSL